MNDWKDNVNRIREVSPGHFMIILDFATTKIIPHLLGDAYAYVWVINHEPAGGIDWTLNELPVFGPGLNVAVLNRRPRFDFAVSTAEFRKMLPQLGSGIQMVHLNKLPAYYVDVDKMKGKTLWDILQQECDYLFYLDIPPATDYGTLVSSDRAYLQSLLDHPAINWTNLP